MFEKLVDRLLGQAIARGEFDHLPGRGRPLDLTAYFETPADLRLAHSVLKNAGFLPREVELLQEIAALKEQVAAASDAEERSRLQKQLQERQLALSLAMESRRRKAR